MDFAEHEDHRAIRSAVRDVCRRFGDDYWTRLDAEHEFPWEFYRELAKGGWVGIAIPDAYGGGGRGITEASLVLEEVAASGAAMNGCSAIHLSIFGMHPVVLHGSEELKRRYLPRVASGELHVAFGVTEPDAGLDTTSITTTAVRAEDGTGDHYVVHGRKVWTSKALESEKVLLLTRTCCSPTSTTRPCTSPRSARWAATRWRPARWSTTGYPSRCPTRSARRARAFGTCWTG
jgi:acyl-CoA dehydrogenase